MKKYLKIIPFIIMMSTAKAYSQCPCSGSWCVTSAADLLTKLTISNPPPGTVITICPLNGQPINLGDLSPDVFPLTLPAYVTLQGNYNLFNYNQGVNTGTTINFPFLFDNSLSCGHQFANANDVFPGGDNNGDDEETTASQNNNSTSSPSSLQTPSEGAFVFRLMEGAQIKNICLAGPKTDTRETEMGEKALNKDCNGTPLSVLPAIQGLCGGVLMEGKKSGIENCEIYGFPMYGVEVLPGIQADHGNVTIDRCYIHNCKGWGFGYGVWLNGGGGSMTCDQNTSSCNDFNNGVLGSAHEENSPLADEVLDLTNTFFFENGKDFDASKDRNSVFMDHCTFSERAPAGANINRHVGAPVCNNYVITTPSICLVAPTSTNPHPNYCQACNLTIKDVGGNRTWIWNSFFYKGQNNMTLGYPNTLDPADPVNPPPCTNPSVPVPFGKLTPLIHIGRDPNSSITAEQLKWNYFINTRNSKWGHIKIAKTDVNYWDIKDPHIEVLYSTSSIPLANTDGRNLYVPDETTAPVPMLQIGSFHPSTGLINDPHLLIKLNDVVEFNTIKCRDAAFNMDPEMLYMWRFHESPYDHEDEIRTSAVGRGVPLIHTFGKVGITNVNLMAIDLDNNFAASTIVTQQITIMPPKPTQGASQQVTMVVNIKDTYDGRNLTGPIGCRIDRIDECIQNGVTLPCQPITHPHTGFQKFISINGSDVWVEDIGDDNGGWERIEMDISDFICTDDIGGCALQQNDEIEIGLRIEPNWPGVDASLVRGISFYVDDVYIQSNNGYNALKNGDFEKFHANGTWSADWIPTNKRCGYNPGGCGNHSYATLGNDWELKRDEVRSGHTAQWGRIRSLVDVDNKNYYPGLKYTGGYLSVKQQFNIQNPPQPRIADTTETVINPGFTIYPNPAKFNSEVNGFISNIPPNEGYSIQVTSPAGGIVYNAKAMGYEFEFNANFPPGVYFVSVKSKSYSGFKKLVVW